MAIPSGQATCGASTASAPTTFATMPGEFVKGQVRSLAGYGIFGLRLDFLGVCPDCQGGRGADGGGASPRERE